MDAKSKTERRKFRRYQTYGDAFAVIESDIRKMGKIVDISLGGLAFQYIGNGKVPPSASYLDIFSSADRFHLGGIPFTTISDFAVKGQSSFAGIQMRRLGVRFVRLTNAQESSLGEFFRTEANLESAHPQMDLGHWRDSNSKPSGKTGIP
jgi:hypothetical protein